jgi:hypothetical protein
MELLDSEASINGVTSGALQSGLASISVPTGKDYNVIGWGHAQVSRTGGTIVMPRPGTVVSRLWTAEEMNALTEIGRRHDMDMEATMVVLGATACDIYMNGSTYWRGVPERVWAYNLGGYPVLKKWLSYREADLLGRALHPQEVRYFAEVVRRITEVLAYGPELDAAHSAVRAATVKWVDGRPAQ